MVEPAAEKIFDSDPRIRSVGITKSKSGYAFRAVRNNGLAIPLNAVSETLTEFNDIPVSYVDTPAEVESLFMLPGTGPGSPSMATLIPEVSRWRPLCCGLQIQNYDDNLRMGHINNNYITIGTLGCFVKLADGNVALLSNNHVIAGETGGRKGQIGFCNPVVLCFKIKLPHFTTTKI